jgi:putative transposase
MANDNWFPGLSMRARGRLVREIAGGEHTDPSGRRVRISRDTLDRWIRAWRRGGFDALVPSPRQSSPRLPAEIIELALRLKRENAERTAAQVRRLLRTQLGWAPGERTLQRYFAEQACSARHRRGGGVRPVRGRPPERALARRCPPRLTHRWTQDLPVRLPRRPLSAGDRTPVGLCRGHRPVGRRAAPSVGRRRLSSRPSSPPPAMSTTRSSTTAQAAALIDSLGLRVTGSATCCSRPSQVPPRHLAGTIGCGRGRGRSGSGRLGTAARGRQNERSARMPAPSTTSMVRDWVITAPLVPHVQSMYTV